MKEIWKKVVFLFNKIKGKIKPPPPVIVMKHYCTHCGREEPVEYLVEKKIEKEHENSKSSTYYFRLCPLCVWINPRLHHVMLDYGCQLHYFWEDRDMARFMNSMNWRKTASCLKIGERKNNLCPVTITGIYYFKRGQGQFFSFFKKFFSGAKGKVFWFFEVIHAETDLHKFKQIRTDHRYISKIVIYDLCKSVSHL